MNSIVPDNLVVTRPDADGLARLASQIDGLPVLPTLAARLLEAVDDPNASASDMADLINSDPALALRLLKLANSAYYGFPRHIGTVNLAVVILGTETVRDLCLSMLITDCLSKGVDRLPFALNDFWKHSITTAVAGRLIFRMSGAPNPGEGFIAGLVHDVGKLFLARYFSDDYAEVMRRVKSEMIPLMQVETIMFQTTHSQVAAWLLDSWNLPVWLVEAVKNHHCAEASPSKLALTIAFADSLVRRARFDSGMPGVELVLPSVAMTTLRLKRDATNAPDYGFYLEKLNRELQRAGDLADLIQQSN
jgi:HD-like signal output (HDOD) protein